LARISDVESETDTAIPPLGQAETAPAVGTANDMATHATKTATRTRSLTVKRSWWDEDAS
jgi:hypothetical protein